MSGLLGTCMIVTLAALAGVLLGPGRRMARVVRVAKSRGLWRGATTGSLPRVADRKPPPTAGKTNDNQKPDRWPGVTVVLPLKEDFPHLRICLESILAQEYPDYEIIFATESAGNSAVPVVQSLMRIHPTVRAIHVVAGAAQGCGQKNRNMLSAIRNKSPETSVLVFCDSSHIAPHDWLRELVRPLTEGRALVSTAYHTVTPDHWTACAAGRAMTVLFMHLLQLTPGLTQTWGGSTALDYELYLRLDVESLWRTNVVDDVSVSALLARHGERIHPVTDTLMATPLRTEGLTILQELSAWSTWLVRQWIYLKFIWPESWLAAGLIQYAMGLAVVGGSLTALAGTAAHGPGRFGSIGFFALMAGLGFALRRLLPARPPLATWFNGFFLSPLIGAWCHLCNWPMKHIRWGGRLYLVCKGGRVESIKQDHESEN